MKTKNTIEKEIEQLHKDMRQVKKDVTALYKQLEIEKKGEGYEND